MNLIYFVVTYRVIANNPKAFLSLGIFGSEKKERIQDSQSIFESIESVPHTWYMFLQLTLVLLFANSDINSRVASTLPLYFWAFATFVNEDRPKSGMSKLGRFACLHNLVYMGLNFILFPTEIGFF